MKILKKEYERFPFTQIRYLINFLEISNNLLKRAKRKVELEDLFIFLDESESFLY